MSSFLLVSICAAYLTLSIRKRASAVFIECIQICWIVILDSPEIYSEYAPYTYIEDMKEFIDKVAQLNRAA